MSGLAMLMMQGRSGSRETAFPAMAISTKAQRIDMLRSLRDTIEEQPDELTQVMTEEYGAPRLFHGFLRSKCSFDF